MKLIEFLDQVIQTKSLPEKTICFSGSNYPFLFFSTLFSFLNKKKWLPAEYKILNFESIPKDELKANLVQSFLGQYFFYWFGDATIKSTDKKGIELLEFLSGYKGPHYIAFYLDKVKNAKFLKNEDLNIVELDEEVDLKLIEKIVSFFEFDLTSSKFNFIKKMFINGEVQLKLDELFMLIEYLSLIGIIKKDDLILYLSNVIDSPEPSLNLLARYFFENKPVLFFEVWSKINIKFPDIFWISFWTEKIYKAYFVVKFLKNNKESIARSISFGLPYNFLKKDWKLFSLNRLSNYHNFLYTNDFKIKRGSNFYFLDLFYLNHFNSLN